jgi:hypothetical protein
VTITLLSETYVLDGGEAALLRQDWTGQPDDRLGVIGKCRNNRIEDVPVSEPAAYYVFLSGCRITHRTTQASGILSMVAPLSLEITEKDLRSGEAALPLPDAGLFQLTLLRDGKPAVAEKILMGSDPATAELKTDAAGLITLLEDPRHLAFELPAGMSVEFRQVA